MISTTLVVDEHSKVSEIKIANPAATPNADEKYHS